MQMLIGLCLVFIAKFLKSVSFYGTDFLCQLQGDKVGYLCFGTFQYVGIDVCSYAYVAVTEMLGYYFNVNAAVKKHCSITVPKLMKRQRLKLSTICEAFQRMVYRLPVTIIP